jgi:uncharacterized membrane protein
MLTVIWVALIVGTTSSAAALYGHYRVLPGWLTGPGICRLEHGGCAVLFRSPRARLLGVPNAALGLGLYAALTLGLVLGWPPVLLVAMTLPAAAMSAFLGYSLIVNKRECRICWAGHAANGMLLVLFTSQSLIPHPASRIPHPASRFPTPHPASESPIPHHSGLGIHTPAIRPGCE